MADQIPQKKGLTTFGWLLLGGAAYAYLGNADRRAKLMEKVKGFTGGLGAKTNTAGTDTGTTPPTV